MKEFKVGERVVLEVVETETPTCVGCLFDSKNICEVGLKCLCEASRRSDHKNVIFKRIKEQKRKMKENKHSLKISRSCGNITLDGYPIATYSNDELKILKNLITKVLGEVNEYIKE